MRPFSHFHFSYSFKYIRLAIILSVVPLVQALLALDIPGLTSILGQELIILAAIFTFALLQWRAAGYHWGHGRITVQQGLLVRRQQVISRPMVAAVQLRRPLHYRILGASQVTFYYKYRRDAVTLCLRQAEALDLADEMMPLRREDNVFRAVGAERLRFAVLSANLITTAVLAVVSARRTIDILGEGINEFALTNLARVEKLVEQVLPVGMAWLFLLIFLLASAAFLLSFLHTAGFSVCRNGGVILARGGLITKTERRILASAVSCCDVRITPIARLLRRSAVYLQAGGFSGDDLPLMVYKRGAEDQLQKLMPEFQFSRSGFAPLRGRSLVQFLWLPGGAFLFAAALTGVSAWVMPQVAPLLALPTVLLAIGTLVSLEGFFTENVRRGPGRTLELSYSRFLTRHRVCVFSQNAAFLFTQHPLLAHRQRCNLRVRLPARGSFRVRGLPDYLARELPLII